MSKTPLLYFRLISCGPARREAAVPRCSFIGDQGAFAMAVVLCFGSFAYPHAALADLWVWNQSVLTGSFTDKNNWLGGNPIGPGNPKATDDITALNTDAGQVVIQCSGNTVANAVLDCELDLTGGGLNITGILHGGEGAVGNVAAGTVLFGTGTVTAGMLQNELFVTGRAQCNIGTAVFPDGTGDSQVFVTGANTGFTDAGDFIGTLSVSNQATASVSGTFGGDLNLASGASVAFNNSASNAQCTVEIDSAILNVAGSFAGQMTVSNSGSTTIAGPAQGSFYLSSGATLKANGELTGSVQATAATVTAGSLSLSQLNLSNGATATVSGDATIDIGLRSAVDGIGSQLKVSGMLSLKNGILPIQNGATVTSGSGSIGSDLNSGGATVEVDSQGTFNVNGDCFVGDIFGGGVWIHGGSSGTFGDSNHRFGVGNIVTAPGSVTVGDSGSSLQILAPATLGLSGLGEVTVTNGATVQSGFLELGDKPGSGGTIGISDPGSAWVTTNNLFVGGLDTAQPGGYGSVGVAKGGTLQVGPLLYISASGAVGVTPGGQIAVGPGSFAGTNTLSVNQGGKLYGNGTVEGQVVVAQGGVFAPGESAGIFKIFGDYRQAAGGELDVVIGGNTAGAGFSQVKVSGKATVNGTLKVTLANGFQPAPGQSFLIVATTSVSGTFSQVNGNDASVSYGADGIRVTVGGGSTPPAVSIQQQGANIVLTWPTTAQGYSLQTTTNLGLGIWSAVPTSSNMFLVNPVNSGGFFRLSQ